MLQNATLPAGKPTACKKGSFLFVTAMHVGTGVLDGPFLILGLDAPKSKRFPVKCGKICPSRSNFPDGQRCSAQRIINYNDCRGQSYRN